MAERTSKRPAGVTRITKAEADRLAAADDRLATVDVSTWLRPELDLVAIDRGLSTAGSDADVRARIVADIEGA